MFLLIQLVVKRDHPVVYNTTLLRLLGIHFFITIFPSIFWSKGYDSIFLICTNLGYFLLVFHVLNIFQDQKRIVKLLYVLAAILSIISILGILEYFGLVFWLLNRRFPQIGSTYYHPNIYSGFLILLLPISYGLILIAKNRYVRLLLTIASIAGLINLFLAMSRASILAHFITLIPAAILYRRYFARKKMTRRGKIYLSLSLIAVIALFLLIVIGNPAFLIKIQNTINPEQPRFVGYLTALRIWTRSPLTILLGNGVGSFKPLYFSFKPPGYRAMTWMRTWDAVHNEYLELLVDGGLLSLAAFILLVSYIIVRALRTIRDDTLDSNRRMISLALFTSVLSLLIDGFFSTNTRVSIVMFPFYLTVALIETLAIGKHPEHKPRWKIFASHIRKSDGSRLKANVIIAAVLLLALINVRLWLRLSSDYHTAQGSARGTPVGVAINQLETAREIDPWNVYPRYALAITYLNVGDLSRFFPLSEEVERLIPNYKDIRYRTGLAYAQKGDLHKAKEYLEKYLSLDQYHLSAECSLLIVYARLGEWPNMKGQFRKIIEASLQSTGKEGVKLHFPEGVEVVRRFDDEDGIHIEFGGASMMRIAENITGSLSSPMSLNIFRLNSILGNLYYAMDLPGPARRHFRVGYNHAQATQRTIKNLNAPQLLKKAEEDPDVKEYSRVMKLMRSLYVGSIQDAREKGRVYRERRLLREYLQYFDDAEARERLLRIYLQHRMYKAHRRLKIGIVPNTR